MCLALHQYGLSRLHTGSSLDPAGCSTAAQTTCLAIHLYRHCYLLQAHHTMIHCYFSLPPLLLSCNGDNHITSPPHLRFLIHRDVHIFVRDECFILDIAAVCCHCIECKAGYEAQSQAPSGDPRRHRCNCACNESCCIPISALNKSKIL